MPSIRTRSPLFKILYDYRHIVCLVLIYATEMTVWAVLNLKGIGDEVFSTWRIFLLVSVAIIACSAAAYYGTDKAWMMFAGALAPWLSAAVSIIVYGFIQMNLHFLSMEWFFACVLYSFILQGLVIFMRDIFV